MCIDFMTASPALSVFNVINYFQLFANCRRRDYNDGNFLETRVYHGVFEEYFELHNVLSFRRKLSAALGAENLSHVDRKSHCTNLSLQTHAVRYIFCVEEHITKRVAF